MATMLDYRIQELYLCGKYSKNYVDNLVNEIMEENEADILASSNRDDLVYQLIIKKLGPQEGNVDPSEEILVDATSIDTDNKEHRKVPLPAHNKVLRDKKFKLNTFACLMASSNKNVGGVKGMEFTNYIYDNKIEEAIEFINATTSKPISKRTLNSHIKSIVDSGLDLIELQNTPSGLVYKLRAEIDGGYYVTIPFIQLKELLLSTNKNALRLFILLKDMCKEDRFIPLDRGYLARGIGLSDKADKNLKAIGTIVNTLANIGLIEIMETVKIEVSKNDPTKKQVKTVYAYRICTLEEYLEAKNRGIIRASKKIN